MDTDWRILIALAVMSATVFIVVGCAVIGSGKSTLVLADPPAGDAYSGSEFRHLIAERGRKLVGLEGESAATLSRWAAFVQDRHGSSGLPAARIDINVRDLTSTPALDLFSVETVTASDVAKILTDPKLKPEEKDLLLTKLRDNFRSMPEVYSRLVRHGADPNGGLVYHYFPHVAVDLTGTLNSAEPLDRFDFLAAAIRIPAGSEIRFINFAPKAADLFDFTLGQVKQTASMTAGATAGRKVADTESRTDKSVSGLETTTGSTGGPELGASLNFTLSDELTRDLKSSLEARSAGILDRGRLFLIELRSNSQKRIAGTYTFNVMLEVPSKVAKKADGGQTYWTSEPVEKRLNVEVRVVGIVRHVVKPGMSGVLKRVPEPLNDQTFREVILWDSVAPLWKFNNIPLAEMSKNVNLTVYASDESASFTIYDGDTHAIVGHSVGREGRFALPAVKKVDVVFHPIVIKTPAIVTLEAKAAIGIDVRNGATVVGSYSVSK